MDTNKKLPEGLLKADGIDPAGPTESERMAFRHMLDREKKCLKGLSWLSVGAVWIFVIAMIGLCVSGKVLEALYIPFVVGGLVVVAAMWTVIIRYLPGHNRKLQESGKRIRRLEFLVHGKHRGLILIGKKNGKRFIFWPRTIMIAAGLWLAMSSGGAGVFYLLCQRWIYSSVPLFHIFFCTVISLSFVIFALNEGLKAPLEELMEVKVKSKPSRPDVRLGIWRIIMKRKITKFAAAAVIIIIVLGGINFWPNGSGNTDWWLGPPAAWGQEIATALEVVKGVSCREQTYTVTQDGTKHLSSTWGILYYSTDSYRRDIYDGDTLREIQWYVPDGDTMLQHSIRFDLESYFVERHQGSFGNRDPIDRVRFYVEFLDSAEQLLGTKTIEDTHCVGFEINASQYGNNPEHWVDQIWFDVDTKLPVVIERRGRPVTDHPEITFTKLQSEFIYNKELPGDTFEPYVPDGYVFGHPDEITSDRNSKH